MTNAQYAQLMSLIVLGALGALGALVIGLGARPGVKPVAVRHRLPRNRRGH